MLQEPAGLWAGQQTWWKLPQAAQTWPTLSPMHALTEG